MQQLTVQQLSTWLTDSTRVRPVLLDVREDWEFQICRLPESNHVPMSQIPAKAGTLDPHADTVVICHHGARSMQVAMYLERSGFSKLFNLSGGVDAWSRDIEPAMPTY